VRRGGRRTPCRCLFVGATAHPITIRGWTLILYRRSDDETCILDVTPA
jgi:hypothetical protein